MALDLALMLRALGSTFHGCRKLSTNWPGLGEKKMNLGDSHQRVLLLNAMLFVCGCWGVDEVFKCCVICCENLPWSSEALGQP